MELRHLRYFIAVAEEQHFGRAAARLHISQPPLSQQIHALEREMGVELFARAGRGIVLTPAGAEFLIYARQVLTQADHGVRAAQAVQRGDVGRLNVGFITSMAYTYLPWVLRVFRSRFPGVELSLTEQETWLQLQAVKRERLHVGIVRGPVTEPGLAGKPALSEPFVVAMPDDHPLAGERTMRLSRLSADPFIVFPREIGGHFYAESMRLFREAGFAPIVAQEAIQMHVAAGLVSARIGVALVPASIELLPIRGVVFRPLQGDAGTAEISVIRRADDESLLVDAFLRVALEVIGAGRGNIGKWR
ncbi:MAG: LysR family transcriptional regulator [Lautropia sp.]